MRPRLALASRPDRPAEPNVAGDAENPIPTARLLRDNQPLRGPMARPQNRQTVVLARKPVCPRDVDAGARGNLTLIPKIPDSKVPSKSMPRS